MNLWRAMNPRRWWKPVCVLVLAILAVTPPRIGPIPHTPPYDVHQYFFMFYRVPHPQGGDVAAAYVDPRGPPLPYASELIRWIAASMLVGCAIAGRRSLLKTFKEFFCAPDRAVNLAVFRILVFSLMVWNAYRWTDFSWLDDFGGSSPIFQPAAGAWAPLVTPPDANTFEIQKAVLVGFCLFAAVGLYTRIVTVAATLLSLLVFGAMTSYGFDLNFHHLVWFAAILACSPCGDALSCDALWRVRRGLPAPASVGLAYGVPLRIAWILMGLIFFFPGFWKLWRCGWDWALSDNLQNFMHMFWMNVTTQPPPWIRPDGHPLICELGALWAVVFECSFVFMILSPRLRVLGAVEGILFQMGARYFLRVGFTLDMIVCLLIFFDWSRLLARFKFVRAADTVSSDARPTSCIATCIVGSFLLVGNLVCGIIDAHSWPFTSYPSFAGFVGRLRPDLVLYVRHADGTRERVPEEARRIQSPLLWYGFKISVLRREWKLPPDARRRLFAWFASSLYDLHPYIHGKNDTLLFYREWLWTDPSMASKNPVERQTLAAFSPGLIKRQLPSLQRSQNSMSPPRLRSLIHW